MERERVPPESRVHNLPVERLTSYLRSLPDVDMAFLFGSFAKGYETKRSDVDVAVHFNQETTVDRIVRITADLEKLLDKDVDLLVLNDSPAVLSWTAIRGIPLLIRDEGAYIEYMLDVSREAEDFSAFASDLWSMRLKRRAEGVAHEQRHQEQHN